MKNDEEFFIFLYEKYPFQDKKNENTIQYNTFVHLSIKKSKNIERK